MLIFYILIGFAALSALIFLWVRPSVPIPKGAYVVPSTNWVSFLLGEMAVMLRQEQRFGDFMADWIKAAHAENKSVLCYRMTPGTRFVMLTDPKDLEYLLLEKHHLLIKHYHYAILDVVTGQNSVLTLRDEKQHTVIRKLINPAFSFQTLRQIANYIVPKICVDLHKTLMKQKDSQHEQPSSEKPKLSNPRSFIVNLAKPYDAVTTNVICEAAFKDVTAGGSYDISSAFRDLTSCLNFHPLDVLPREISQSLPIARNKLRDRRVAEMRQVVDVMAKKAEEDLASGRVKEGKETLIDILVKEKAIDPVALSDNSLTFALAGQETTFKALSWTTYLIAKHQDVQARILEELEDTVAIGTTPTLDDLKDCTYLEQVIKESLRLYPPVAILGRDLTEEVTLPASGVTLPKGIRVQFHIFALQRLEAYYGKDANEFNPSRWDEENKLEEKIGRCGWIPFWLGKRSCIGKDFALNEIRIVLASMIRSFKIELVPGAPEPKPKWALTLRLEPDPDYILTPREE